MKHLVTALALLSISPLYPSAAWAHEVEQDYKAIRVVDGSTVRLAGEGKRLTCRLHGIAAPEKDLVLGQAARESLSELLQGHDIHVHVITTVERNILGCRLFVNGKDIGREQVARGMARKFNELTIDAQMLYAENHAKARRLGLWSDVDTAAEQ